MDGDTMTMSRKEWGRVEVITAVMDKRMTQRDAAQRLSLSVRQLKRLVRAFRDSGAPGLVSKRRGKPSGRRIAEQERSRVVALVREQYADFGPTLAAEYLRREHGFTRSVETLRGWMTHAGVWTAASSQRGRAHPPRERRARRGELIQIDGSPHDWLEGRGPRCCLIAFIDDATSGVMSARFAPVESTAAYLSLLQDYVLAYGVPGALYSDRHSIFTKHDPEDPTPTQFERAVTALGCEPIQARSPQAKGRIERLFKTLQDRLSKALRLAGIGDIAAANAFLPSHLDEHNARFAVAPRDTDDAHQPWTQDKETLSRLCAEQHERALSKDLVVRFRGQRYIVLIDPMQPRYALRGKIATVCVHHDDRIELLHGTESLPYRVFDDKIDRPPPADEKSLNQRVDDALARRAATPKKPSKTHPWKRYPVITKRPPAPPA